MERTPASKAPKKRANHTREKASAREPSRWITFVFCAGVVFSGFGVVRALSRNNVQASTSSGRSVAIVSEATTPELVVTPRPTPQKTTRERHVRVATTATTPPTRVREPEAIVAEHVGASAGVVAAPVVAVPAVAPVPTVSAAERERLAIESLYPMHGVSFHFLSRIYSAANASSRVIGYLRRGSSFRVTNGVSGPGCPRTWHELSAGGFVCRGEGVLLGATPQSFSPSPLAADRTHALPYRYAYISGRDVVQYWRLPTSDDVQVGNTWLTAELQRDQPTVPVAVTIPIAAEATSEVVAPSEPLAAVDPGSERPTMTAAENAPQPVQVPAPIRMRMRPGYFVTVDGDEESNGVSYTRTVRGGYVESSTLASTDGSNFHGIRLGDTDNLPVGFVFRRGAQRIEPNGVRSATPATRYEAHFLNAAASTRAGQPYRTTIEGYAFRASVLRVAEAVAKPNGIPAESLWIHVDLSEQTLVAYEGTRAVYATMVASGRAGFATPVGLFRVQSKHVSTSMDDLAQGPDSYSIEDVPWTMFFKDNFALHTAFWHDAFGTPRSHGCINLAPRDAHWLFEWSTPSVPTGWHGVLLSPQQQSTYVYITE